MAINRLIGLGFSMMLALLLRLVFSISLGVQTRQLVIKQLELELELIIEGKVESVDNDMAHSMASKRVGFDMKSLLEQWRDSYKNGDYDEDPYDDDMYEGQGIPNKIQDICNNLDIRVRGRKKK
ncbi:hypothetical protein Tco_0818533 [Tanacetum coccineum]